VRVGDKHEAVCRGRFGKAEQVFGDLPFLRRAEAGLIGLRRL